MIEVMVYMGIGIIAGCIIFLGGLWLCELFEDTAKQNDKGGDQ